MPPAEAVKVMVRCRPLNQRETSMGCKICVNMSSSRGQVSLTNPSDPSAPPKSFTFDGVYFIDSITETIYSEMVFPLVENCIEGYNGTVFAYGQTGSGKSFSMQGPDNVPAQKGIIPRAFEHIFEAVSITDNCKYLVHASYLEIYNEEVRDLLGQDIKQKLEIKEHPEKGVYVAGLSMHGVHSVQECAALMERGLNNRATGATLMNTDSSRSHSLFSLNLEVMEMREDGEHIKTAKLNLVDLAGSERQSKTGATGERLKEATKINLSLSALGNVISALVDGKSSHIPYRDSKLTRLLQDSLGGNTKTLMCACISPADNNYDETLSTVRYANRAKNIKNKPTVNEDPKDALLRQYQEEIQRLMSLVEKGTTPAAPAAAPADHEAIEKERQKLREEYEAQMSDLKNQYETEQKSKAMLQVEMAKLKESYEQAKSKVEENVENGSVPMGTAANEENGGMTAPSSSPTDGLRPDEALKRLELLQKQMVGGEQSNNKQLKDLRKKRMKDAEKRRQRMTEALKEIVADDDPMLKAFENVEEKLDAVQKSYDKERKKTRALENEVQDLQSEFELDRMDYLDTIRKQDQQLKLLQQILDKVQPSIRRDCNYYNVERVKRDAVWDEDLEKWQLPDMTVSKTQFPGAATGPATTSIMPGGRLTNHGGSGSAPLGSYNGYYDDDGEDDKLKMKLMQSEAENLASNYFKPIVSDRLISNTERDKNRNINFSKSSNFPSQRTWDSLLTGGVIYTDDLYQKRSPSQSANSSRVHSGPMSSNSSSNSLASLGQVKKPARLESLHGTERRLKSAKRSSKRH